MKKYEFLLTGALFFFACAQKDDGKYKTILSKGDRPEIVRTPGPADYSFMRPGKMKALPSYNPDSEQMWQVDLRSSDLTELDPAKGLKDLLNADFDSRTKWPAKLPAGFDPAGIMELGKNPGLGLRALHKRGITGKGVGIAVIDQGLLVDHAEYKDRLKMYEEIHCGDEHAQMHGPAVASIAVGKNVGVAPGADLYYIAETHGVFKKTGGFDWDLSWLAKSIDRVVEINNKLPAGEKIRVISISLGIGGKMRGSEKALKAVERATAAGIYTVYVGSNGFKGLGRAPLEDPDLPRSFERGRFWRKMDYMNDMVLLPMDSRCAAAPNGTEDYVFYREGGMSWAVPYAAGLYALACQVKPDITPEIFWEQALKTGDMVEASGDGKKEKLGKIVNPAALIESLGRLK